tara:strand:+ start:50 stop:427 length:378 start_codon:yes stop_codon:yes gene_type:complete
MSLNKGCGIKGIFIAVCILIASVDAKDLPTDSLKCQDSWRGFDKVQHATFSFLWVLGVQYIAVNKCDMAEKDALQISFTTSASLGLLKEIFDRKRSGGHFCKKDLAANALGLILASAIVLSNSGR